MHLLLAALLAQVPVVSGPDAVARLVLADLGKVNAVDRPYTRYLDFSCVPDADLKTWRRLLNVWKNTQSTSQSIYLARTVQPGLVRIDLRDYRWNAAAWRAVADREPFFREPWINSAVAKILRTELGEIANVKTFHVYAVVRADWFFRETAETDRSTSYYDLLYADRRFTQGGTSTPAEKKLLVWKGGIWPADGKHYEAGAFEYYDLVATPLADVKFVDFPKNKVEWNKAWGLDKIEDFLKESKLRTSQGAVAIGMLDDPKRGSFVARQNRLLTFQPCATGVSLESYDVLDGTGERDYVQNAPNLSRGKIKFDAQELLISLPNGLQAAFLVAGDAGARVEFADNKVAIDADPLDRRVRTPGSCYVCHAVNNGVIPPINMVKEFFAPGKVDVYFKDKELLRDFNGFFLDEWELKIEPVYQTPYKLAVAKASRWELEKPWTGIELSKAVMSSRAWYDRPLDLAQCCRELGVTELEFKGLAAESPLAWPALVVRGEKIPRKVWDVDVFKELGKQYAVDRLKPFGKEEKPK